MSLCEFRLIFILCEFGCCQRFNGSSSEEYAQLCVHQTYLSWPLTDKGGSKYKVENPPYMSMFDEKYNDQSLLKTQHVFLTRDITASAT